MFPKAENCAAFMMMIIILIFLIIITNPRQSVHYTYHIPGDKYFLCIICTVTEESESVV